MDIALLLSVLSGLFVVIGLAEPLAARLRLPVSVVLAAIGIALGLGAGWFYFTTYTDALNEVALAILTFPVGSQVFIYVFLPTLIFQVALTLNLRRIMDDWVPILVLAVVAVAVATWVIGFALYPFSGLPLIACLLIGAIVSTTDPSAVVSIFRATPAPQRLARIVEGESLLNDAAAIALFGVFLTDVLLRETEPAIGTALLRFPGLILGGAFIGWLVARLAMALIGRIGGWPLAQISISIALPYAAFLLADQLESSGVVAVVAAGMTLNFLSAGRMSPPAAERMHDTWDLLAYWAGSLIFIMAALLIPRLMRDVHFADLGLVLITAAAAFVARALILFGILPLLTTLRLSPKVERPYRIAILWGGLRGAVTLALALAVTEDFGVPVEVKRQVGIIATGFTLFTLLVQGTTLRWVISKLGLDKLSRLDRALGDQVVAVALQSVRETVADTTKSLSLTPAIVRDEAVRYGDRLAKAVERADEAQDILDRDRVTLGLIALAGQEREVILSAFRDEILPAHLAERLLADADRLIEATRLSGRHGYRTAARAALRPDRLMPLAGTLHNRLRWGRLLSLLSGDRFEMLIARLQVLRQLHGFIEGRIVRIHGKRVAALLHDLVDQRITDTDKELEGLRLQFPGHAEELERRLIRRISLQEEVKEYEDLTEDGLIGPELRNSLFADLDRRRRVLAKRPRLDLALQKTDIVAAFPLFEDMQAADRARLAKALRTVYAPPGKVLFRKEDIPTEVYFIASGAVEVLRAGSKSLVGQRVLLGRGEMFGQLSILTRTPRRARITTVTHCTFLTLDEARFIDLLGRHPALAEAVSRNAASRGVKLDLANLPPARPRRRRFLTKARALR